MTSNAEYEAEKSEERSKETRNKRNTKDYWKIAAALKEFPPLEGEGQGGVINSPPS